MNTEVFTDGGCHGNPGPGAWAFVVAGEELVRKSGGDASTTNNRMELQAVIEALRFVAAGRGGRHTVTIHTDSQYVKNGITSWIDTWLRNGWMTSARKPVKNRDLWIRLRELDQLVSPEWKWVRGHAGNPLNEECDRLVQEEIARIESHR